VDKKEDHQNCIVSSWFSCELGRPVELGFGFSFLCFLCFFSELGPVFFVSGIVYVCFMRYLMVLVTLVVSTSVIDYLSGVSGLVIRVSDS